MLECFTTDLKLLLVPGPVLELIKIFWGFRVQFWPIFAHGSSSWVPGPTHPHHWSVPPSPLFQLISAFVNHPPFSAADIIGEQPLIDILLYISFSLLVKKIMKLKNPFFFWFSLAGAVLKTALSLTTLLTNCLTILFSKWIKSEGKTYGLYFVFLLKIYFVVSVSVRDALRP